MIPTLYPGIYNTWVNQLSGGPQTGLFGSWGQGFGGWGFGGLSNGLGQINSAATTVGPSSFFGM
jgi:hypothetical protein